MKFSPYCSLPLVILLLSGLCFANAPWNGSLEDLEVLPRINIVHVDTMEQSTYYYFLCTIPMAVFHHGDEVYASLALPDDLSDSTLTYLLQDWNEYLDQHQAKERHANFIGDVSPTTRDQILSQFSLTEFFEWDTITGTPIEVANRVAEKDWNYCEWIVIAPYKTVLSNLDIESVSNGAVIASLLNAPLLFTEPDSLSLTTLSVISSLGAAKAVLVEIEDVLSSNINDQLDSAGVTVMEDLRTKTGVVGSIRNKSSNSTLCTILNRWQGLPAAYLGARYGGYVLFLPDSIASGARKLWEKTVEDPELQSIYKLEQALDSKDWVTLAEEEIAQNFYDWLTSVGGNDPDSLETVIAFEPQEAGGGYLEPTFERAISGDPSDLTRFGAIPGRMPLNWMKNIALANRTGMYRATIFANPRPFHVTLSMNAYEVRSTVDAGSPVPDSWGSNHVVNEIFGWPYRGWCADNDYFPWDDIHSNPPDLSPILPPGDGTGADCDPGGFVSLLSAGYEVHFHNGAHPGPGSHPSQPDVENMGFVNDINNGSALVYFSCHGGGDAISAPSVDGGIGEDLAFGDPYWPASDGRVNYSPGSYSQDDLDQDLGNIHGTITGFNACHMASGYMNEILLEHGGNVSIGSYTSVSFTGSAWWWNLFTYLTAHEGYTVGEAAAYATARSSNLLVPSKTPDVTLRYVVYGDPNCPCVDTSWESPVPVPIDTDYGGHIPDKTPNEFAGSVQPDTIQINTSTQVVVTLLDTLGNKVDSAEVIVKGWGVFSEQMTDSEGVAGFHITAPYGEPLIVKGRKLTFDLFCDTIEVEGGSVFNSAQISATVAEFSLVDTLVPQYEGLISGSTEYTGFTLFAVGCGVDTSTFAVDSVVNLAVTPTTEGTIATVIAKDGFDIFSDSLPVLTVYGTVSGAVMDTETEDSLGGVVVKGYEAGADTSIAQSVFEAVTDSFGIYAVPFDIPVGMYDLYVCHFGYLPFNQTNTVARGSNIFNVFLSPAPLGTVQGTVMEEETLTLLDAVVQVYRVDNSELYAHAVVESLSGGTYSIALPYFDYDLKVSSPRHIPQTRRVSLQTITITEDFYLSPTIANLLVVDATGAKSELNSGKGLTTLVEDLSYLEYSLTIESYDETSPESWSIYDLLIFSTGNSARDISNNMKDALLQYVSQPDNRLLIEGGDIGYHNRDSSSFQHEVLNIGDRHLGDLGEDLFISDTSHPIATFPNLLPDTIEFNYDTWTASDILQPDSNASDVMRWSVPGLYPGVIYESDHIVFFTFDYSKIDDTAERRELLQNVLQYLFVHYGFLAGTVLDAATMEQIEGAIVRAGEDLDTTDLQGSYNMKLASSIYDIVVSAKGYNADTLESIQILAAETTAVNFLLTHPEIEVSPAQFFLELREGLSGDTGLVIVNDGNGPLTWNIIISEVPDGRKSTKLSSSVSEVSVPLHQFGERQAPEWLWVDTASGLVDAGGENTVDLHLNAGDLLPDTIYSAIITILNNSMNDSVDVRMNLAVLRAPRFIRGDPNGDEVPSMTDAVEIIKFVYLPGYPPPVCLDGADVNDDGEIFMSDALYLMKYLYVPGSPPPLPPFDGCGKDPTVDGYDCDWHPCMDSVLTRPPIRNEVDPAAAGQGKKNRKQY